MKTLHNIFHNKLIKSYLMILLGTVASLIIGVTTTKMKEDSSFMSLVNTVAFLVAGFGPLFIFFINTNFPHNVKFLINQHFSRSELLQFFFFSQTLKVILGLINYSLLVSILYLISGDADKIVSLPEISFLYSGYFIYFVSVLSGIYVFYFFSLSSANKQDLQRIKVAQAAMKKNQKKQWAIVVVPLACAHIIINYTVPDVLIGYLWCLFIAFTSLTVLNRTFKLYHQKKSYVLSSIGSFVLCLPLVVIFIGMKKEAQDSNISYKLRAESVIYLNWLNSSFSKEQMLGFLANVDNEDYKEILQLFGDRVDIISSLKLVNNEYKGKKFIDFHSRKYSQDIVREIVSHMSELMIEKRLNFRFAQYSHSFFIKQKVDDSYIQELVTSERPYDQLASIYFAKNSFNKDKFLDFYRGNLAVLDKSVINDTYVRRSIASEKN